MSWLDGMCGAFVQCLSGMQRVSLVIFLFASTLTRYLGNRKRIAVYGVSIILHLRICMCLVSGVGTSRR